MVITDFHLDFGTSTVLFVAAFVAVDKELLRMGRKMRELTLILADLIRFAPCGSRCAFATPCRLPEHDRPSVRQ
jgi:hypothetical protein